MFEIVALSFLVLIASVFIGAPVSALTFLNKKSKVDITFTTFLTASLLIGFGISAFSIALAYGFLGINYYLPMILGITIIFWAIFIKYRSQILFPKKENGFPLFLLTAAVFSIYFTQSQWNSSFGAILKSGNGTDISQNLMAAQVAQDIGSTWSSAASNLINSLSVDSISQAAIELFRHPSFKEVAGYDYLVFGGRWGLTIFYNQIIRFFGPQAIMWEIGVVLLTTLMSLALVFFTCARLFIKSNLYSSLISLALVSNAGFFYLFYNGGLSQAFGTIGISGILLTIALICNTSILDRNKSAGIFILATSSWIMSAVTYVDATFIVAFLVLIYTIFIFWINKALAKSLIKLMILPGALASILIPFFTYSILVNLSYRIDANIGTGNTSGIWKTPSQLIGIINVFKLVDDEQSNLTFIGSIFISIGIFIYLLVQLFRRSSIDKTISYLGLSSIVIVCFGFVISLNSREKSDYIYNKVTLYIAPFLLFSLLIVIFKNFERRHSKSRFSYSLIILSSLIVISGLSFHNYFQNSPYTTVIPNGYKDLLQDLNLRNYLKSKNFLQPYKGAYNFTGLFGAEYWISKAPNDMILSSRIDNELLVLCFFGDSQCNPTTEQIKNVELEKYGILIFRSKVTTREFAELSIIERFNLNFDAVGQPRLTVPLKFQGGNPYLK
jgi:hypothetical protein